MSKEIILNLSRDEAKILFDALSSHRYKMISKKGNLAPEQELSTNPEEIQKADFIHQRIEAIEREIDKSNTIFQKLGEIVEIQLKEQL
jgi:hypothetical protein